MVFSSFLEFLVPAWTGNSGKIELLLILLKIVLLSEILENSPSRPVLGILHITRFLAKIQLFVLNLLTLYQ